MEISDFWMMDGIEGARAYLEAREEDRNDTKEKNKA